MRKTPVLFIAALAAVFSLINGTSYANNVSLDKHQGLSELINSEDTAAKGSSDVTAIIKGASSYLPHLQLSGTRFFNVSESNWGAGVDFLIPLWQSSPSHLVFTDFRLFDRTGRPFEGNIHLGYRYLSAENTRLHGIYGAFDRKRSINGNYFNQLTFGVETWYKSLFIGANYYQPIGRNLKNTRTEENKLVRTDYVDKISSVFVTPDYYGERAAGGGDAEIGYEFFPGITGYVGGHYFKAKDMSVICGPKVRVAYDYFLNNGQRALKIFDKVGVEAGMQHDQRGDVGFVGLNIRVGMIPSNGEKLQGVARHMVDLVHRDVDIVSQEGFIGTGTQVPFAPHGKALKFVSWNDTGDDSAIDDLKATLQKLDPNKEQIVIVRKGSGLGNTTNPYLGELINSSKAELISSGRFHKGISGRTGKKYAVLAEAEEPTADQISLAKKVVPASALREGASLTAVQAKQEITEAEKNTPDSAKTGVPNVDEQKPVSVPCNYIEYDCVRRIIFENNQSKLDEFASFLKNNPEIKGKSKYEVANYLMDIYGRELVDEIQNQVVFNHLSSLIPEVSAPLEQRIAMKMYEDRGV